VIAKSEPSRLGAIRLNKILWYTDALAFRASGASITGETYIKRQHGPVSKHVLTALGELEHDRVIVIRKRDLFAHQLTEYIAVADPDLTGLSTQEIAMVEGIRGMICDNFTAMEISEASHDQVWQAANIGEEIPMVATLASFPGEITEEVQDWADSAIGRFEVREAA
jgi:hypothetical protein